jgi:2-hydroxy-6-oxonona-2,4-dienedioate hydrolase
MPSFWNTVMPLRPRITRERALGIETRVIDAGPLQRSEGCPVLLIHGASGHLESFMFTMPELAVAHRVVAFDLPSHGYATCPPEPYDVVAHAKFVVELARCLGLGRVSLVGQSLGGAIAGRVAIDQMLDVDRLVLIGSAGVPDQSRGDPAHSMKAALAQRGYENVRARLEYAMSCRGPEMDELVESRYLAYQWGDWQARSDAFTYHETDTGRSRMTANEEEWASIDRPTLLVWGAEDRVVLPLAGERLSKLIPDARLVVVEGCGHNPQFERPSEVNPLIVSFLSERLAQAERAERGE